MANQGMTRTAAAKHFKRSPSTIRSWQQKYKEWLHVKSGEFRGGVNPAVEYDEHDQQVFTIVDLGLREGMTHKEIAADMDNALAVATTEPITQEDEQEADRDQPAPEDGVLMTEREARISTAYAQLQGKMEAIESENEYLRRRNEELEAKLIEESKRTWLQRLLGR